MPLRVAACPRCNSALVYGERQCRGCAQTFQYGAPEPPIPTGAQILEALRAAGVAVPMPPSTTPPASPPTSVAPLPGLDTGRFEDPGQVRVEDIPGLIDSTLFRAFTPAEVQTAPVAGLDVGRFDEVGPVAPAFTPGLEVTPRDDVGEVFVQPVMGLFRSDIYRGPDDVATQPLEGFEPTFEADSPAAGRASRPARAEGPKARGWVADEDLEKVLCRCSEVHRLPRCPACGTPHPVRQ